MNVLSRLSLGMQPWRYLRLPSQEEAVGGIEELFRKSPDNLSRGARSAVRPLGPGLGSR